MSVHVCGSSVQVKGAVVFLLPSWSLSNHPVVLVEIAGAINQTILQQ